MSLEVQNLKRRSYCHVQARMQLTEGQAHQLLACRRTLLCELGVLISEWDQLWSELQVGPARNVFEWKRIFNKVLCSHFCPCYAPLQMQHGCPALVSSALVDLQLLWPGASTGIFLADCTWNRALSAAQSDIQLRPACNDMRWNLNLPSLC